MTELTTLYCGRCRRLVPMRDMKLDKKSGTWICDGGCEPTT